MNKLIVFIILFFAGLGLPKIQAQTFKTALEYMDHISATIEPISKDLWSYTSAASHGKGAKKVENRRKELIQSIKNSKSIIEKMPPFEGDASLRDSVIANLELYHHVMNEDFEKILDMEEIAEQSFDLMEAYLKAKELAQEKLRESSERLSQQYKSFGIAHYINIIENTSKLEQKIKIAEEVYKYYNKAYLIFFKVYKQEGYLIDAFSKTDINAMQQNRNALLTLAKEASEKAKDLGTYKGDASILNTLKQLIQFYMKEAEQKAPEMIDFYIKKKEWDDIKTTLDNKPKNQRTQQDVDQYNKMVNDYNSGVNKYNKNNQELNDTRSKLLDNWNKINDQFLDKHVPK